MNLTQRKFVMSQKVNTVCKNEHTVCKNEQTVSRNFVFQFLKVDE